MKMMMKLERVAKMLSGTPQFRIAESFDRHAPTYTMYSQQDLMNDLSDEKILIKGGKQIQTEMEVSSLKTGEVIFSLISGTASVVRAIHDGYMFTHNYVKLVPSKEIDSKYLVYILNEDRSIRKQFLNGLQGSQVLKYSMKQLKELILPDLPCIEKQRCVGEIYLKQLRVQRLKESVAELETILHLERLKEVLENDRKSI